MKRFLVLFFLLLISNQIVFAAGGSLRGDIIGPPEESRLATLEAYQSFQAENEQGQISEFEGEVVTHERKHSIACDIAWRLVCELRKYHLAQGRRDLTRADMLTLADQIAQDITKSGIDDQGLTRTTYLNLVKLEGQIERVIYDIEVLNNFLENQHLSSPEGHLTERGLEVLEMISKRLHSFLYIFSTNFNQAFSTDVKMWSAQLSTYEAAASLASMGQEFHVVWPTMSVPISSDFFTLLKQRYADRILRIVAYVQAMSDMNFYVVSPHKEGGEGLELHDMVFSPRNVLNHNGRNEDANIRLLNNLRTKASMSVRLRSQGWKGTLKSLFSFSGTRNVEVNAGEQRGVLLDVTVGGEGERNRVAQASGRAMRASRVDRIVGEPRVEDGDRPQDKQESRPARWLREARARIASRFSPRR